MYVHVVIYMYNLTSTRAYSSEDSASYIISGGPSFPPVEVVRCATTTVLHTAILIKKSLRNEDDDFG